MYIWNEMMLQCNHHNIYCFSAKIGHWIQLEWKSHIINANYTYSNIHVPVICVIIVGKNTNNANWQAKKHNLVNNQPRPGIAYMQSKPYNYVRAPQFQAQISFESTMRRGMVSTTIIINMEWGNGKSRKIHNIKYWASNNELIAGCLTFSPSPLIVSFELAISDALDLFISLMSNKNLQVTGRN